MTTVESLRKRLHRIQAIHSAPVDRFSRYRNDPHGYARDILGIALTPDQKTMLEGVITPPYRVFGRAGHTVGKSHSAAVGISWLYDTRDPCMILSTAPRLESVKNIIWRELHSIRAKAGLGGFKTSSSLEMRSGPNHFALGMTARNTYGFHGKHELRCFIVIDEATGVEPEFFDAADSMLNGEEYGLLAIYNPFSTSTRAWEEEQKDRNRVVVMSCLNHPNIAAELQGKPAPYPSAVRYEWVDNAVKEWSDQIPEEDADAAKGDFLWPPPTVREVAAKARDIAEAPSIRELLGDARKIASSEVGHEHQVVGREVPTSPAILEKNPSKWYRPGPLCRIRVKGEWPTEGIDTVWSEILFETCRARRIEILPHWRAAIGCDVARFGDDMTVIVVRRGPCVVHIEEHSGWDTSRTTARLKALAYEYRGPENERAVRVFVDEPGMGAGVIDHADGYNFIGINPASKSGQGAGETQLLSLGRTMVEFQFTNMRAQLWFDARDIAKRDGAMDLSRIPKHQANELKRQLLSQTYDFRPTDGAVFCHDKDKVKEKIGRSPDMADALNLAFCRVTPVRDTFSVMR